MKCSNCGIEDEYLHTTYPESDCHHCLAFGKVKVKVCQDCWETGANKKGGKRNEKRNRKTD